MHLSISIFTWVNGYNAGSFNLWIAPSKASQMDSKVQNNTEKEINLR